MYKKILIFGLSVLPFEGLFARTRVEVGPQGLAYIIVTFIGAILICVLSNSVNKRSKGMHWFLKLILMLGAIVLTILILWGVFAMLIPVFENFPQKWSILLG